MEGLDANEHSRELISGRGESGGEGFFVLRPSSNKLKLFSSRCPWRIPLFVQSPLALSGSEVGPSSVRSRTFKLSIREFLIYEFINYPLSRFLLYQV